jgi:uncharacterized protein (UPF0262 family)
VDTEKEGTSQRISKVFLDEAENVRLSPQLQHERRLALMNIVDDNHFEPLGGFEGPYILRLSVKRARLVFTIDDEEENFLTSFGLPIAAFHKILKDYFAICDSYLKAIKALPPSRIEAIDMGRRAVHNEGAELLEEMLSRHVRMSQDTARRLFTLVCVLHIRV